MKMNIWKYSEMDDFQEQTKGKKVILAGGCFDLLHYGHFQFLQQAKKEGDLLVIALESDEFINHQKKRPPIHTQLQRAEILASIHLVDHVILLPLLKTNEEYAELVKKVNPAIIAITDGDPNVLYKQQHAKVINAEVKVVSSLLSDFSTTQIMNYENIFRN